MNNQFEGIRVVELAQWVFVTVAGALLADWGADVIRVEPPAGLAAPGLAADSRHGCDFQHLHRNKRSLSLNLKAPEAVIGVHAGFIRAGAELIETNTFGANRRKLSTQFLDDRLEEIVERGVKLAREAREVAGAPVLVGGAIGPLGEEVARMRAGRPRSNGQRLEVTSLRRQAETVVENGAPERTETSSGSLASPNALPVSLPIWSSAFSTCALSSFG